MNAQYKPLLLHDTFAKDEMVVCSLLRGIWIIPRYLFKVRACRHT